MSPHATRISARAGVEQGGAGGPREWIMGDAFEKRMPHHEGIRALWETRWRFPVIHTSSSVLLRVVAVGVDG